MLAQTVAAFSFAPAAPVSSPSVRSNVVMETVADLKSLATELNPVLGYWDPLGLAENYVDEAPIGYLRQAELKHGRVAMAAFVGFIVQSNGITFPGKLTLDGVNFADIAAAGGPGDQWDALPTASKLQIIGFVGIMEWCGENTAALEKNGQKHYMRGGKPGYFPPLNDAVPFHPVPLNLWDPFGIWMKSMSEEQKQKKLVTELNNGRLAMLGIMSLCSASKGLIVPGLSGLGADVGIAPYAGDYMAPFASGDASLPLVADMLKLGSFMF